MGRRLRFSHFYGLQLNSALRGLPSLPGEENAGDVSSQPVEDESDMETETFDSELENELVDGELSDVAEGKSTPISSEDEKPNEEVYMETFL